MQAPFKFDRSVPQRLADYLLFPLNMWLGEEASRRLGLTPIDHERVRAALPHCRGALLDVGCGNNLLVQAFGDGVGVDVHPYPEIALRCDSAQLPFRGESFDTVALLACLNHITRREETLAECHRVLRRGGIVLVTMISAWIGWFSHKIRMPHDPDQLERGMQPDEDWGLSSREVLRLLESSGFRRVKRRRFFLGMNNLYLGEKP